MGKLAERYGINSQKADPDPYPVDVTSFGRTHHVTCDALGISEEFEGSYTAALDFGKRLVKAHLREHGPVKIERVEEPGQAGDDDEDVFGGY
jgi:hypothetical protein